MAVNMRSTGFTPEQVAGMLTRDLGMCAMVGESPHCAGRASTGNHRLNRGAGGSKLRNGMANGCSICDWCNNEIEVNAEYAARARHLGVKLREGQTPELEPIWSPAFRQWVQLTDAGLYLTGDADKTTRPILILGEAL